MATYDAIKVDYSFGKRIATITLQRPEVHNAFNAQVVAELTFVFRALGAEEYLHGVVLTGAGSSFSAGADIHAMKEAATFTQAQNLEDALRLADLLQTIYTLPCPVIARVNGLAMGGGVGLIAACDSAIAVESARFAFSEVKLGIAPAVISPYVIRKIGEANARALFVTGSRFSAQRALAIGLVQEVVAGEQLDEAVQKVMEELLSGGPAALRACKALALTVGGMNYEQARNYTAETIARLRTSAEGQEGLSAFLEKRKAAWITQTNDVE